MRGRLVLLAAAGVLLVAGCGGDDERARPSAKAKRFHARSAEFNRRGEAICRDLARATAAAARGIVHGDPVAAMARVVEAEERIHRRFARLEPPGPRARRLHRRAVAAHRAGHRISERLYARIRLGVPFLEVYRDERARIRPLARRTERLYKRLGLPACTKSEFEVLVRGYY